MSAPYPTTPTKNPSSSSNPITPSSGSRSGSGTMTNTPGSTSSTPTKGRDMQRHMTMPPPAIFNRRPGAQTGSFLGGVGSDAGWSPSRAISVTPSPDPRMAFAGVRSAVKFEESGRVKMEEEDRGRVSRELSVARSEVTSGTGSQVRPLFNNERSRRSQSRELSLSRNSGSMYSPQRRRRGSSTTSSISSERLTDRDRAECRGPNDWASSYDSEVHYVARKPPNLFVSRSDAAAAKAGKLTTPLEKLQKENEDLEKENDDLIEQVKSIEKSLEEVTRLREKNDVLKKQLEVLQRSPLPGMADRSLVGYDGEFFADLGISLLDCIKVASMDGAKNFWEQLGSSFDPKWKENPKQLHKLIISLCQIGENLHEGNFGGVKTIQDPEKKAERDRLVREGQDGVGVGSGSSILHQIGELKRGQAVRGLQYDQDDDRSSPRRTNNVSSSEQARRHSSQLPSRSRSCSPTLTQLYEERQREQESGRERKREREPRGGYRERGSSGVRERPRSRSRSRSRLPENSRRNAAQSGNNPMAPINLVEEDDEDED